MKSDKNEARAIKDAVREAHNALGRACEADFQKAVEAAGANGANTDALAQIVLDKIANDAVLRLQSTSIVAMQVAHNYIERHGDIALLVTTPQFSLWTRDELVQQLDTFVFADGEGHKVYSYDAIKLKQMRDLYNRRAKHAAEATAKAEAVRQLLEQMEEFLTTGMSAKDAHLAVYDRWAASKSKEQRP